MLAPNIERIELLANIKGKGCLWRRWLFNFAGKKRTQADNISAWVEVDLKN
jgi:hypothetical protein